MSKKMSRKGSKCVRNKPTTPVKKVAARECPIPPPAIDDPNSVEMLRAWITNNGLHCTLETGVWNETGNWGILLADVARHVANAHEEADGTPREQTLSEIRTLFDAELDKPTDEPTGRFADQ